MTSKGGKIPSGSKVSAGSKVSSGKSEQGSSTELGMSYWELQVEAMNRKQLREKAKGMDLSTSGSKDQLKNRIKKELMKEKPIEDKTALQNIPEGSITTAHFEEEDFQVSIIDQDIEPHIEVKTERLGEGAYSLKQKSFVGEDENLIVTVSDPSPFSDTSKPTINNNIMTKKVEGTSQVKPGVKKKFSKREVLENQTAEIPGRGRATQKVKARVVPKGKQPYHWEIVIPNKTPSKDFSKQDKIIITEKSEVEKVLKSLNPDYTIHNLGGNPFGSVQRTSVKQNPDGVRRSKKRIIFRQDKAFATFYYPVVNEKAEVIIIADEDYLGQYLSENLAQTLPTEDITIYNVESTSPELLAEVLAGKHSQYNHNVNKAIAGSWYVESQSEVGATITSALTGKDSMLDNFTREQRGNQTWSTYKKAYLQGTQGLNISDQELAVMGKVLEEEINQESRIIATIETDLGLQVVEATAKPTTTEVDALFQQIGKPRDLNIKNTDQTTMILMKDLGIESSQAEDLIKRLSSQGVVSYPRTEYEGISPKEDVKAEILADIWLSYLPEYQNDRRKIVQGIKRIQTETPELPRSGIIVLSHSDFVENTIERNTIESIAKANIWASLGYYEVNGELQIVDQNKEEIGKKKVDVITKDPSSIGKVIDVQVERKHGMSDKEMFEFLSDKELGTTATRTNLIKRLEKWGFLLKSPKGEYKLDDRGKVMTLTAKESDPDLTSGFFTYWLKGKRGLIEKNPNQYNADKEELYQKLAQIVKSFTDREIQERAEQKFHTISKQTQSATFLKQDLEDDLVQIDVN